MNTTTESNQNDTPPVNSEAVRCGELVAIREEATNRRKLLTELALEHSREHADPLKARAMALGDLIEVLSAAEKRMATGEVSDTAATGATKAEASK
jgi:hypothetical protein